MNTLSPLPQDRLKAIFNDMGLRFTSQREVIWRLFEKYSKGLTIAQATTLLVPQKISQTTVYRTVKALEEMGYLRWVHSQEGEHRYLTSRPGHSHMLVCRICSKAVVCTDCDLSILEQLIASKTGFTVEGHYLEFYGICPDCAHATQNS